MSPPHLYLVILAGGSGTRLWPLSRKSFPKQFLKVGEKESLVRATATRCVPLADLNQTYIVCGSDHLDLMKREFPELDSSHFLLEPCARNTAAAIAFAAYTLFKKDPEAILAVLPADHKILNRESFQALLQQGAEFAQNSDALVTLGISPQFPATGYGYIQQGEKIDGTKAPLYRVKQFQEKPDLKTAESYLRSGNYLWNSGMFIWKASTYCKAYQALLPKDAALWETVKSNPDLEKIYPQLTSISVDYAILEKYKNVVVIPSAFDWDDVGSLQSLARYYAHDAVQNSFQGEVATIDASGNLLLSDQGVVACLGVENLIIIRQGDAVLVLPKERSEEVKKLLEEIKQKGLGKYL